jgi:hypothetical protein
MPDLPKEFKAAAEKQIGRELSKYEYNTLAEVVEYGIKNNKLSECFTNKVGEFYAWNKVFESDLGRKITPEDAQKLHLARNKDDKEYITTSERKIIDQAVSVNKVVTLIAETIEKSPKLQSNFEKQTGQNPKEAIKPVKDIEKNLESQFMSNNYRDALKEIKEDDMSKARSKVSGEKFKKLMSSASITTSEEGVENNANIGKVKDALQIT